MTARSSQVSKKTLWVLAIVFSHSMKFRSRLFPFGVFCAASAWCGTLSAFSAPPVIPPVVAPVIGGSEVVASDPVAQTTVLLKTGPHPNDLCSATLISESFAITAAHCLAGAVDGLQIIFGTNLATPASVKRISPVVAALAHPNYHSQAAQDRLDVGIVKFTGGLPAGYHAVRLVQAAAVFRSGQTVWIAGYGTNDPASALGFGVLRKTSVKIQTPRFGSTEITLDESKGHGACYGDSGGPAFVKNSGELEIFAMTSRGAPGEPDCKTWAIYTLIRPHLEFFRWAANQLKEIR
ncbi:MAG: trypsin-like serine protease [Methylotenera sp.]|nr:trypsin-like serine protease [Oligoflexia bacterium]